MVRPPEVPPPPPTPPHVGSMATRAARPLLNLPDQGWGWVVVFGCAVHTFVTGALIQYFTLIYEHLRERFDSTAAATAWIFSIHSCISMMFAPITSIMVDRFGCRPIVMLGVALLTLGILGLAYVTSLPLVYLLFAISGVGNGLIITPKFIAISHWFESHRGRAKALETAVDGCGALILVPCLYVVQCYVGFHASLVTLAACLLQCMVGGALLRMPFTWEYRVLGNVQEQQGDKEDEESLCQFEKIARGRIQSVTSETATHTNPSMVALAPSLGLLNQSMLCEYVGSMDDIFVGFRRRISQSCNALALSDGNALARRRKTVSMEEFTLATVCGIEEEGEAFDEPNADYYDLYEEREISSGCEWTGDEYCDYDSHTSSVKGQHTTHTLILIKDKIHRYLDYRLLVDPSYLSYTLLAVMFVLGGSMKTIHFAGLCKEKQLSELCIVILIAIMGGITTVLKIISRYLFERPLVRMYRKHMFFMTSLVYGAMLAIAPQMSSLPGVYVVWSIFTCAGTILITQESIILAELVAYDSLPCAIGINRLCRSLGLLVGPSLGGYLKDSTGDYYYSYLSTGVAVVVAAILFELVTSWKAIRTCDITKNDLYDDTQ